MVAIRTFTTIHAAAFPLRSGHGSPWTDASMNLRIGQCSPRSVALSTTRTVRCRPAILARISAHEPKQISIRMS